MPLSDAGDLRDLYDKRELSNMFKITGQETLGIARDFLMEQDLVTEDALPGTYVEGDGDGVGTKMSNKELLIYLASDPLRRNDLGFEGDDLIHLSEGFGHETIPWDLGAMTFDDCPPEGRVPIEIISNLDVNKIPNNPNTRKSLVQGYLDMLIYSRVECRRGEVAEMKERVQGKVSFTLVQALMSDIEEDIKTYWYSEEEIEDLIINGDIQIFPVLSAWTLYKLNKLTP